MDFNEAELTQDGDPPLRALQDRNIAVTQLFHNVLNAAPCQPLSTEKIKDKTYCFACFVRLLS